jgi:hypothetical protein
VQSILSFAFIFSVLLSIASCSSEDTQAIDGTEQTEEATETSALQLSIVTEGATRAASEGTINNLYVILSDRSKTQGNISYKEAVTPTNGKITLKVRPSSYDVYVWANVPASLFTSVTTLSDLSSVKTGLLSTYRSLPMCGKTSASVSSGQTATASVTLSQLTAKFNFNITSEYPSSRIVSAKIYRNTKEIPLSCNLSATTNITTTTDSIDLTKAFYVWQNTRIGKGSATDWGGRDSTDAPLNASYLELAVQLFGEAIPATSTYRIYLGGLTSDGKATDFADYNIYPGVAYTYDITLKRNGIAVCGHVPNPGYAESKAYTFTN